MLTLFLLGFASAVAWMTLPQIKFSPRGMEWGWHWAHFEPFSNGIQKARTHDTKQLLLRRVYLDDAIVVFVSTTLDNKFEIDVVQGENLQTERHNLGIRISESPANGACANGV